MVDIASLAIKIDTSDVAKGEQALDKLTAAGVKAEKAADGVGDAWSSAGVGVGKAGTAAGAASAGMDKAGQAARRQAELMKRAGLSAGQYNQAMRLLPMQLTDVVTSLSSGMPLWMVAIQQGGQIRDSFGGIGNAARGVAGAIPLATAAFAGAAAAGAAILIAFQKGQAESQAYSRALILTGNAAGTSADELANMAQAIDGVAGTQRNAAQALAEVAGTGKFAADQIQGIATAAILMEQATGKAVSDTVKEFARLADEPAAASAKLNDQYNYLTASVYEQITALEQQGNTTEAARLATEAYATSVQQRAGDITSNLGALESAWKGIATTAAEAWDAMLNVGREDTLEQQLADAYEQAQRIRNKGRLNFDDEFNLAEQERRAQYLQEQIANRDSGALGEGQQSKINQAAIDAQREVARIREQSLTKAEQKEKAIADYLANLEKIRAADPKSSLLNTQQIDKDIAAIEARFEVTAAKQKAYTDSAATRMLQQLSGQEASLRAQLASNDKLTAAQQAQVQFAQQIADLKEKRILTAEQKSLLANKDAISAQLEENAALEDQLLNRGKLVELERLRIDILRSSGQKEAAAAAQFELDYAKQRVEYERAGNVEALARLETLRQIQMANIDAGIKPGAVEGVGQAPDGGGVDAAVAGLGGEFVKLNEQAEAIAQWQATELEKQQAYLEAKAITEEVYAERIKNINTQAQNEIAEVEASRQQLALSSGEEFFGNMSSAAKVFFGENSKLYKAAFAVEKAYAIGKALINVPKSYSDAFAAVVGIPLIGPALAPAAGAAAAAAQVAQAAMIGNIGMAGMAHDGIDSVPREGTWLLDKGERVVDKRTNGDLKAFLSSGEKQSQPVAPVVNVIGDRSRAGQTDSRQQDGRWVIDVIVADVLGDGRTQRAMSQKFGMQGVGR